MRLEAVTICHEYSDFLEHSLPENLQHVDHMVVVTSKRDKKTKDLCNHLGVVCVDTDVFFEHGDKFNKGRGINYGMNHLRHDGWLLHLDADTVLPHRTRSVLNMAHLDPTCIYGADRLTVTGYETWMSEKHRLTPQYKDGFHVDPHANFKLGSRLLHGDYGYVPIGYFQLWHSSQKRFYPGSAQSSEHSDVMFAIQWARDKRHLLPHFFVYHLESERCEMGANWQGRKTRHFGPREHGHGHRHEHHHCPPPPPCHNPYRPKK